MTDEERQRGEARARKMAELDPGLCASAGGEPYREQLAPQVGSQPVTPEPEKTEQGVRAAAEAPVA